MDIERERRMLAKEVNELVSRILLRMHSLVKANDSQVRQFRVTGAYLESAVVTPSGQRVLLTADYLQGLDAGEDFNETLVNTLPSLWHADHVVRLHTDFYNLVQDESCWDRTKILTEGLERTDKIWIMHLREGDGWLCVCMDWTWRQVKCYNPLTGWEAYRRREKVKNVSCRFPIVDTLTNAR